MGLTYYNFKY